MRPWGWSLLGIGGLLLAACGGPAALRYERQLDRVPAASAHGVHEQRLAELMASLDRLRNERLPRALDVSLEEERQSHEVARVARAMAESAAEIPAAASAGFDASERALLLSLSRAFRQRTERLAADAPQLSGAQLRARFVEIDTICADCHRQLRIPGRIHDVR